jgi:hypothetical protein
MTDFTLEELYNHYLENAVNKENLMSKEEFEKYVYNPRVSIYGK